MDTTIFALGAFVFLMVAAGLTFTVVEFKRLEKSRTPRSERFPL